jgi:hypothetical protein
MVERAIASATATIGRFTRKIDPQLKCARSHPPSVGPIAMPRPVTADHIAMALARSDVSEKTLVSIDSVDGMMAAAPRPITTRLAIS